MRAPASSKTKTEDQTSLRRKNMNPHYSQGRPSRWSGASNENYAEEEKPLLRFTEKGYNSLMSWL